MERPWEDVSGKVPDEMSADGAACGSEPAGDLASGL